MGWNGWELVYVAMTFFIGYIVYWYRRMPSCPRPLTLPILGTLNFYPEMDNNTRWMCNLTKSFEGKTWACSPGGAGGAGVWVMISDPECVEHILKKNFTNYVKGPEFSSIFNEVLGQGIFNVDGDAWKLQRKTASHLFNTNTLKNWMLDVFISNGNQLIDLMANKDSHCWVDGKVDLQDMFQRFTLDSIAEIGFGCGVDAINSQKQEDITVAASEDEVSGSTFGMAFDVAQTAAVWRFLYPFWRFRKMIGTPTEKRLCLAKQVLDKFAYKLIAQRRQEDASLLQDKPDVLSWFMRLRDEHNQPYSDEYLRDVIMNFMIAGRDTTANALTWVFYLLSQHPDVLRKLRKEVESEAPKGQINWQALKNMKYTEAVVREALRLYPSVPRDPKYAVVDDVLPDGTFVPAGTFCMYLPHAMGRLEHLWGKPAGFNSDADVFDPERWMDPDFKVDPYKYPIFQAGLRTCLGMHMAILEAKCLTAMLCHRFDFEVMSKEKPEVANSVTCPMRGGLFAKLELRQGTPSWTRMTRAEDDAPPDFDL